MINGRPALFFNGTGILNTPSFILGNTVVTVARRSSRFEPVVEGANVSSADRGLWGLRSGSSDFTTHLNYGINGGPLNATNADGFPMNVLQIVSQTTAKGTAATTASIWRIGGGGGGYVPLNGIISELISFPPVLSTTDRQALEINQGAYYGITGLFGGGDHLLVSPLGITIGTGDFTVESWFRIPNTTTNKAIIDFRTAGATNNFLLYVAGAGLAMFAGGSIRISGGTAAINTWHHAALSRSAGTTRLFLNGIQVGSSYSDSVNYQDVQITVGNDYTLATPMDGHIDEVRISNSARYTANFTAPTASFQNDANTLLLLHMDGTDASTFFEDDNGVRAQRGITAVGNAQIDTAQSKFGGASFLGDGNGDYLQIGTYSDLNLTGDLTIECWFRIPGAVPGILSFYNSDHLFYLTTGASIGGRFAVFQGGSNRYLSADVPISANVWYHIAFVRSGGNFLAYLNGVTAGNSSAWTAPISNANPTIGVYTTHFLNGWIDEFRISNSARYTAGFTPATTPFVNDANTLLLLHMDGTNGSTIFRDDNGVRAQRGITAVGNAQIDTSQSQIGGASALFDGNGDYLTVDNTGFLFQAGESVTMECWIRLGATATEYYGIMSLGSSRGSSSNEYYVFLRSASETGFVHKVKVGTDFADIIVGTTQIVVNTWYHIAVVRNSNTYTLYVNGTAEGTNSARTTDVLGQNTGMKVGAFADGSLVWNGHIDEVRISNTARYTANFTAPTTPFVNDANTLFLMHADGTNGSTIFRDDNGVTPTHNYS
jgi:hypothetical protein